MQGVYPKYMTFPSLPPPTQRHTHMTGTQAPPIPDPVYVVSWGDVLGENGMRCRTRSGGGGMECGVGLALAALASDSECACTCHP